MGRKVGREGKENLRGRDGKYGKIIDMAKGF
jgi:hypothetical protein